MKYATLCSGIEAPSLAWPDWEPQWFSEIEPFPSAVLAHHYPDVPNHGDMTKWREWNLETGSVDLVFAGTPCQSFSIAGLRGGLDDDRGNLALEFMRIVDFLRPTWVVWENVPGVLSASGGRDFGAILGALAECGYGFAYRVLDAQNFGVPQRRRRVFLVGHIGDWRSAAAVLFERTSLRGDSAPRSKKRKDLAPTISARSTAGGGLGTDFDCDGGVMEWPKQIAPSLNAHFGSKQGLEDQHALGGAGLFVTHTLCGEGFDASEDGTGRGTPLVFESRYARNGRGAPDTICPPLKAQSGQTGKGDAAPLTIAIRTAQTSSNGWGINTEGTAYTLDQAQGQAVYASGVRRLTPTECLRLQGMPDGYTQIPWRGKPADQCPDGPQYKAIGNSIAVPCLRWIGERLDLVDLL